MAKYEIMLVIAGTLEEKKAKTVASEIDSCIKSAKPEIEEYGLKELAYKINKNTHGYYFQYNFETDNPKLVSEFRRLCNINKNVLRHLIINLEKDYGYRATVNPKKVEKNKKKAEIYQQRKAEYEKIKEARMAEMKKEMPNIDEMLKIDSSDETTTTDTQVTTNEEKEVSVTTEKKTRTKKATTAKPKKETTKKTTKK